jgi:two-component system chemotaxis response regulator CheB
MRQAPAAVHRRTGPRGAPRGSDNPAQDEASCVVFGMPKEAIRMEGAQQILPLDRIPAAIGD